MLDLKNVHAGYGKQDILNGINLSFAKGKLTCIIGVNGSGKSTLLKAAVGIIPISSGTVLVDGQNIANLKRNSIAKKIAYLAQGKNIPDMTVEQMVLHGRFPYLNYPGRYTSNDKEIAFFAIERVGLKAYANKPLYTLSGGMRQNAYIAMALAQNTDYILLDEPTTYLDIAHQIKLMNILQSLAKDGKGIISVMHDLPLAFNNSDELVIIENGTVAAQATPFEIKDFCRFKEIFSVKIKYIENEKKYIYI